MAQLKTDPRRYFNSFKFECATPLSSPENLSRFVNTVPSVEKGSYYIGVENNMFQVPP